MRVLSTIVLSFPVDFQNPNGVERFVLEQFAYFLSRGQKKYHSISLLWRQDLSTCKQQHRYQGVLVSFNMKEKHAFATVSQHFALSISTDEKTNSFTLQIPGRSQGAYLYSSTSDIASTSSFFPMIFLFK